MSNSKDNTDLCHCLTDCIDKTDKARHLINHSPKFFSAKERQFLLLISSKDNISTNASATLLNNVPVQYMLEAGLVKKNKSCSNFEQLLTTHTSNLPHIPNTELKNKNIKLSINNLTETNMPLSPILQLLASQPS